MTNLTKLNRVVGILLEFFDSKSADSEYIVDSFLALANDLQEPFFEMCVSYIQKLAESESAHGMMWHNRETARRMMRGLE